jgi:hypothetical protein
MLFAVQEKLNYGRLGKIKYVPFRSLDSYDKRDYAIKQLKDFKREKERKGKPLAVIQVTRTNKKFDLPVFSLYDLRRVYLTTSNHFILKGFLTKQQKEWIKNEKTGWKKKT